MAGIGFELKKLFRRKGLFASLRAYGYAGIICTGPMLLGVALQMGILLLCGWVGAERAQQDLLVCMITYTLLFSLTVTSFFSMPVTRYLADMLYEEREQAILPSFWGSSSLMLVLGCSLYGLFLLVSGATLLQGLLCLWLFAEMIVNWNGMSYLTAIKDYRGILCSFLAAIGLAFGLGLVLVVLLGFPVPEGMLFAVAMGYGLMMVWDVVLLYRYFPQSDESPWTFLKWVDEFLPLAFTGLCTNIGLFAHLVICWVGPVGVQVKGLFYGAPYYDVPALIAFLTILITSINFVVSVEVNFYPKYRDYYSLFNDGGVVGDIVTAEEEMLAVLNRELRFTALKQLFVTAAVLSLEGTLLDTAMDELYAYMNQDRIESMLAHSRGVTEEYVWRMPDRLYVPITHEQYEEVLESIWPEIDEDYDYYWESYHNPMPFYIGTPSLQNGVLQLSWDTSYDFNAEDISYTVELARDYQFRQMVYREEHVVLPMTQTAAPAAGQYFIRVRATNVSGYTQDAFDYYVIDSGKVYGVKCFYIQPDGTVVEDTYEE